VFQKVKVGCLVCSFVRSAAAPSNVFRVLVTASLRRCVAALLHRCCHVARDRIDVVMLFVVGVSVCLSVGSLCGGRGVRPNNERPEVLAGAGVSIAAADDDDSDCDDGAFAVLILVIVVVVVVIWCRHGRRRMR